MHQVDWDTARSQMTAAPPPPVAGTDPGGANDRRHAPTGTSTKAPNTVINLHFNAPTGGGAPAQPQMVSA